MSWHARLLAIFGKAPPLGRRGEHAAADFLKSQGYKILGENVRLPGGEIDLIAQAPDGKTIVIVEVKSSAWDGQTSTPPEVHVNRGKQRKLADLASQLVKRRGWGDRPVRFDVIGVVLAEGKPPVIRHHLAAFESYF